MNWDHIEDNWKQFSATVKEKWGRLTDDEIAEMKGKREKLEAKIQQTYGHAKDQIKKDIDEWYSTLKDVMNWDHIEDNWKQYSATVKEKWGRLTNDQIAEMKGKREQLEAKIQQVYGDIIAFCQFSFASKFVRHVSRLRTLHHNGPVPETQNGGLRRAKALGVSRARFRPVTCRALCWIGAASGRRKSEELPLLLPIVRQIPGEHYEPYGRQLDWLTALEERQKRIIHSI